MAAEVKGKSYGMSAEVQRKINAKYDKGVEEDARRWIEDVVGEPVEWGEDEDAPGGGFADGLRSGEILCKLANKLQPGAITKISETKKVTNAAMRANKEKENIEKFIKFCEAYGVKDTFSTPYLYQKQNVMAVVNSICQLGSTAQNKGFSGPTLGPKIATENKREFTEEQLKAGEGVIGLQMGSNQGASQAGDHYGRPRQVAGSDAYS